MTPEDSVGERMRAILRPDDAPIADSAYERRAAFRVEHSPPEARRPVISSSAAEPIRRLLREGDYAGAAASAYMVLDSLGVGSADTATPRQGPLQVVRSTPRPKEG